MSYESRVIIVNRRETENFVFGSEIARFELSAMGREMVNYRTFCDVFKTPIDFNLYGMPEIWTDPEETHPDQHYREDAYGAHCKMASVDDVLAWLEASNTAKEYRRARLLQDFLVCMKEEMNNFDDVRVVHFGH